MHMCQTVWKDSKQTCIIVFDADASTGNRTKLWCIVNNTNFECFTIDVLFKKLAILVAGRKVIIL